MARIDIDDVVVTYGGRPVIDGQSMTIPDGCFFTILGPSGCGKTTFLRLIAGFLAPARGRVAFAGRDVTRLPAHRRDCGMVFQDYALFPDRSVFENVAYGLRARHVSETEIRRRVGACLERVELAGFADRQPAALSGGQRQRVALARALVIEPLVLLLDEPLSALDARLAAGMQSFVRDIQRDYGVTTVFVTHDQRMALTMSDRVALLRAGGVEQIASPREIYHRPRSTYAADFLGAANLLAVDLDGIRGEVAQCRLGGARIAAHANGCRPGDAVRLCIREEEARILAPGAADQGSDNRLGATVTRLTFMGEATRVELRLQGGAALRLIQPNGFGATAPEPGSAVTVELSPGCCLVREV